ncbi:MAG: plastocyanin/azurin family copper-binding protein [Deinococcales bacterium]
MKAFRSIVWAAALVGFALSTAAAAQSAGAQAWKVSVGGLSPDHKIDAQIFAPSVIVVDAGDTVTWTGVGHTVLFTPGGARPPVIIPNPKGQGMIDNPEVFAPQGGKSYTGEGVAGSGLLTPQNQSYALTFPKPGVYRYLCGLHPGMRGTVVVQPAGTPYPHTAAEYEAIAKQELQAAFDGAERALAQAQKPYVLPGPGGSKTYEIWAGIGTSNATADLYAPATLTIHVGDTVVWTQPDVHELHSVTFTSGAKDTPADNAPHGGHTYSGVEHLSSGLMGPDQRYALTFTKAGTFHYFCTIHDTVGMEGTIVVLPN